ncbi:MULTISPECIES: pyridoxamine 5'-phosphate oxidase family protein [unclassified Bacillus (in: firmicutes)]|uniref:pyridoxamine 5'-phosphate oxidase family protein n=1 Tax=unclassified Bacillus (in: firmicutes) TaxID=185979 RepID=UPI0008E8F029|nr:MULTISPECIES: pyridoxamine 5'-phosphate oxidase family protein [unclassified Bacillus (in: firmicutes)]SFA70380.1 hypothetical protein SAMN02799634_101109 [Bacillus sp. UNCCL13]SFQ60083.1 hypothetical protein SAMN04488577_0393 [Bacillus sp. cl95]
MKLDNKVTSEELTEIVGEPSDVARKKVISFLDEHCRHFIERSPFIVLSTSDADGKCDASPRGDAPGFVSVLNEKQLLIPDRKGNNRVDSLKNIIANPHVGLLFLIPGLRETLRINGKAFVTKDSELLEPLVAQGIVPKLGIVVEVEECYLQCGKAVHRSGLWNSLTWASKEELPSPAKIYADHVKIDGMDEEAMEKRLEEGYLKRLY